MAGIEHLDVDARLLVREHADAGLRRLRPRRVDHRPRLLLDDRLGLALEAIEIAGA